MSAQHGDSNPRIGSAVQDSSQMMVLRVDKPGDKLGNDWGQASGSGTSGFYPESTPASYRHYSAFMPAPGA